MRSKEGMLPRFALSMAVLLTIYVLPAYSQKGISNGQSLVDHAKAGMIGVASQEAQSDQGESLRSAGIGVSAQYTAIVDEDACATGLVQCSTEGHTAAAASRFNHNPVAITVQVLNAAGVPVTGLGTGAFTVSTQFVPAGGAAVQRLTGAPSDFQSTADGVYRFFVHPAPQGVNWKSGAFAIQVRVSAPGVDGRILVPLDIPF